VNADAGKVLCSASVADPEKEMVSPTRHFVPAGGVSIDAVGGVLPTEIGMVALVADWFCASVTRSFTL
jgi:hypothetical protein